MTRALFVAALALTACPTSPSSAGGGGSDQGGGANAAGGGGGTGATGGGAASAGGGSTATGGSAATGGGASVGGGGASVGGGSTGGGGVGSCSHAIDTSFGNGGYLALHGDFSGSLAVQSDGKLLLSQAGIVRSDAGSAVVVGAVVRLDSDGTLDTTFGDGGSAPLPAGGGALLVQPDAKILVMLGSPAGGRVVRLEANGAVDLGFGDAGTATLGLVDVTPVASRSDGSILFTGTSSAGNGIIAIERDANGASVTTFGDGGFVVASVGQPGYAAASTGALLANGDLLTGGACLFSFIAHADLLPLTPTGLVDTAFGDAGSVVFDETGSDVVAVGQQSTTNIVALTRVNGPPVSFSLSRYTAAGARDATFGDGGSTKGYDLGLGVFVQPADALVVYGVTTLENDGGGYPTYAPWVEHFTSGGEPFFDGGRLMVDPSLIGADPINTVSGAMTPDGKLIAVAKGTTVLPDAGLLTTSGLLRICP